MRAASSDIADFLLHQIEMEIVPGRHSGTVIEGLFSFSAMPTDGPSVTDRFRLRITVPDGFPRTLPEVTELNHKIARTAENHVNPDGTLCLGSPLGLRVAMADGQSLSDFSDRCLVPFLYATSLRLSGQLGFYFGELDHGAVGVFQDYKRIFGVTTEAATLICTQMLSIKKRVANKRQCPCSCGRRLGKCPLHLRINSIRSLVPRSWFLVGQARRTPHQLLSQPSR